MLEREICQYTVPFDDVLLYFVQCKCTTITLLTLQKLLFKQLDNRDFIILSVIYVTTTLEVHFSFT